MPVEVISEPYVGREESRGGFGKQRLFVTVRLEDGSTARVLAADAIPKTPKGKPGKFIEGEVVLTPVKPESPEEGAENA